MDNPIIFVLLYGTMIMLVSIAVLPINREVARLLFYGGLALSIGVTLLILIINLLS